jgi:hypothetical protein
MASIYESQGPQVALTGPRTQGGFQPGQAYDASSMMLRQSERDLTAFAQFSESLMGFLQDKAKKKNEEEYQLGLAEVIDGTVAPTPAQTDQYQASATLLQNAASADNQVSKELTNNGQLAAGEQFKAQSQAISGWRAYGRAVGSAKQVATNAQSFFLTWMENSKDKVVPTEDGRMISPAEAKSPAEIQAALAVGQQTLIKQSNIRSINPVIIAEHLAPTIQAVKGQMFANKLSSEVRKAKETAVSDITGVVRSEFSNPDLDIDGMAESFQRNVKAFEIEGGLSRGAASDTVIQEALDSIATLPEEQATMMLEKLSQVKKIANDPNSLSLGSAYANMFGKTLDTIEGRVEAEEAKQERKLGKQAEQAWGLLKKAEQDATLPAGELQALRKQTIGILGQLADQGSTDALKYRTELLSDPINVDYTLYRQLREGIAQGKRPSDTQLQGYIQSGKLSPEMGRELGVYATSSDEGAFKKQFGPSISDAVKAKLKEAGAVSLDPFNRPETNVLHVEQVTNDLVANVYRWRQSQISKGQTPDDNDINQFVVNELPRTIGKYFQQNPNTKAWTTRPLSRNPSLTPNQIKSSLSGPVRDASGFNPRTIQLRSYNSGSTIIMSKAEVEDNIQRMTSNQPMTRRAEQLASSQGGPVQLLTNQAKHYGIDPKPILSSPEAQRLSQYSAAAPWATQRYNAAGGNYRQQMFQLQRIVEAQARAANAGKGPEPTVTVKSGPSVGTKDLIKLGLSQGLDPEKAITMAAVALGESGGRPSAHNPNRSTGDNSYGLWQINMIDELGPERARALGIKDYNQLKDPNVNARAMKMILNSQGLNAWSVHRNRLHLQYLPEARRAYAELKKEM